ncbi:MAG TPA: DUF3068 domain-containing protein [Aeromicrobium sp.]|nr:DUF3068 domain-containing protein [Aeromicrobium sp.]
MRKFSRGAVTFLTLGAFLATLGLSMKFYAYDKLAVVPLDQNTRPVITDDNATFFDADNVAPGSGPIQATVTVIGDPDAAKEASKETGVEAGVFTKGQDTDNNGEAPPIDFYEGTFAIDRFTGAAVDWSGATENGEPQKFEGQIIKFPFNTQKKTYKYWDGTIGAAMDMKYEGTEKVEGTDGSIETYRFAGTVPETVFATREVPRGIFGLEDTRAVDATRTYTNNRTIWVEPETGAIVKVEEAQKQMLLWDEPGAKPVVAMDTVSSFTPETIQGNIDTYKSKAAALRAVRTWLPLTLGGIGALLVLIGAVMAFRFKSDNSGGYTKDDADIPVSV